MSVSVQASDRSCWRRAIADPVGNLWCGFWRIGANVASPTWSFVEDLSEEELAACLLLIAAHI